MEHAISVSVDSTRIAAVLHTVDQDEPAPVVVCCHGLTGTRMGSCYRFVRLARCLGPRGIACIRFDFRGCGESEGRFQDLCADIQIADLKAILGMIPGLAGCDGNRIGIVGSSFGAHTAAIVAPQIAGLGACVLWAPVADPKSLIDRDMPPGAEALLQHQGWLDHAGLRLGRDFFERIPDDDAPAQLAAAATPTRIFHARGDTHVPFSHAESYCAPLRRAGIEVDLHPLELEDHGMRTVEANDTINQGTVDWFERFLLG